MGRSTAYACDGSNGPGAVFLLFATVLVLFFVWHRLWPVLANLPPAASVRCKADAIVALTGEGGPHAAWTLLEKQRQRLSSRRTVGRPSLFLKSSFHGERSFGLLAPIWDAALTPGQCRGSSKVGAARGYHASHRTADIICRAAWWSSARDCWVQLVPYPVAPTTESLNWEMRRRLSGEY